MEKDAFDTAEPSGGREAGAPGALSLLALWRIVWGRKWRISAVVLAFMLLGYLMTSFGPRTFTAETLLVLEDTSAALTNSISRDGTAYDDPTTAVEVFGSRRVFERVVDRMELTRNPAFNPFLAAELESRAAEEAGPSLGSRLTAPVRALLPEPAAIEAAEDAAPSEALVRLSTAAAVQEQVQFLSDPRSTLIRVRATAEDPRMAAALANTTAEAFLGDLLETRLDAVDRVVEQLGRRVSELRADVRARETALQDFLNEAETLDPDVLAALGDETLRLRSRLAELRAETAEAETLSDRLETIAALPADEQAEAIRTDPLLAARAAALGGSDASGILSRLGSELAAQTGRQQRLATSLQESLDELEDQIATKSAQQIRFQQLQREAEASTEIYDFSVRRLNELSVQGGVEGGGGRIVIAADVPQLPDGRGRVRTMIILGILGLVTALTWVLVREATNQTIRNVGDLQTVLQGRRIVPVPRAAANRLMDGQSFARRLLIDSDPTPYSEAIRRLRSALLLGVPAGQPAVLQVTSDYVIAGRAVLAIALARSCALLGRSVLLVGADMRADALRAQLRVEAPEAGLQQAITGAAPLTRTVQPHETLELDMLLATESRRNPADLIETEGFGAMLEAARKNYDVVIVDTPPVLSAPDAALVSHHADRVLFVTAGNASTIESVRAALRDLPEGLGEGDVVALYAADIGRATHLGRHQRRFARL